MPETPPVRAAVFDLGNTLWFEARRRPLDEVYALIADAIAPLLAEWGIDAGPLDALARDAWEVANEAATDIVEGRQLKEIDLPFIWRGALAVRDIEITEEQAIELWRASWLPVRELGLQLYPDAIDVLRELRELGLNMAIVTTRPCTADMLWPDLHDFGLAPYFDAAVCTGDTGWVKPHPSAFERALELLGVAGADAVMIGDSCEGDMRGARAVGMRTVLKLNGRYDGPACAEADYVIHDLAELLALPIIKRAPRPLVSTESLTPHEDANADRY